MAHSFFQLLRDRILNRAFIILPGHTLNTEENQDEKSASDESDDEDDNNSEYETPLDVENVGLESIPAKEKKQTESASGQSAQSSTSKDAKLENLTTPNTLEPKRLKIDLESFYSNLKNSNSLETRCDSVINLAICLSKDSPDIEISDCLAVLKYLSDSSKYPDLAVCHGLLLCTFTRLHVSKSFAELGLLEERILSLAESLKKKDLTNGPEIYKVEVLSEHHSEISATLCQELFGESYLDINEIDIPTICCSSLNNISVCIKQHDRELGSTYSYKNSTIKYILGMTGKSTQEIVSENISTSFQKHCPSISSYRIKLCLQVLEHALTIDPDLSYCESLNHESFSLPHCLTRLLGWSASHVFPTNDATTERNPDSGLYFKFHHSTLVCILKVLSVLTFNPEMYDTYTNVKGLMEKILICALKAYFETDNSHFDIQVLCLEMLINLYIKNQKTFVLLCLKKFRISETEEVLAVEALIKMLSDSLEKIKEVKGVAQGKNENSNVMEKNADLTKDKLCASKNETSAVRDDKNVVEDDSSTVKNDSNAVKDDTNAVQNTSDLKDNVDHLDDSTGTSIDVNKVSKVVVSQNLSNKDVKEAPTPPNSEEAFSVLQAASKDMEHSTIVSFICVLIVFFMRTKQNFKEFILERLTSEDLKEATTVSQKFLEFASLTGGMPVTGILILSQTINKLQQIQSRR